MTGKEPGAFFCILFYGAIKEYGAEWGRNPAILTWILDFCVAIHSLQVMFH